MTSTVNGVYIQPCLYRINGRMAWVCQVRHANNLTPVAQGSASFSKHVGLWPGARVTCLPTRFMQTQPFRAAALASGHRAYYYHFTFRLPKGVDRNSPSRAVHPAPSPTGRLGRRSSTSHWLRTATAGSADLIRSQWFFSCCAEAACSPMGMSSPFFW